MQDSYNFPQIINRAIRRTPFARFLLPLVPGILLAQVYNIQFNLLFIILPLFFIGVVINFIKHSNKAISVALFYLVLFLIGYERANSLKTESQLPNYPIKAELLISQNPYLKNGSYRTEAIVKFWADSLNDIKPCNEKVMLYLYDSVCSLSAGDVIICKPKVNHIKPPLNPLEFNYKRYMQRKQVFASVFLYPQAYVVKATDKLPFYVKYPLFLQKHAYNTFGKAGLTGNELGVAIALTTGAKYELDDETFKSYSASGTIHLLAVSGLHVGILFMLLSFLLSFMNYNAKTRIAKNLIILAMLWLYTSIAGMSPSVVRASFMFSVFIVGSMLHKPRNTYNNLAFSAFVICFLAPSSIFDLGFLLSYSAVLAIVYFSPKFILLLNIKNKFLNKVWELCCVTTAAQLGTLPIILFNFHQFPIYFLFTNLFLVPYTSVVMYITVFTILLSWQPVLLALSGKLLALSIELMNATAAFFEKLPYSLAEGIYINGFQCALLVLFIILLAIYLSNRNAKTVMLVILSLICVFVITDIHVYKNGKNQQCGVYSLNNGFFMYFMQGGKAWCLRDSATANTNFDYNTKNHLIANGFKSERDLILYTIADSLPNAYRGVVLFGGKRLGIASDLYCYGEPLNKMELDYIIVNSNGLQPEKILQHYHTPKVILGNVNKNQSLLWEKACDKNNICLVDVKSKGAWINTK